MLSTATSLRDLGCIFWGWKMRKQTVNRELLVPSTSMAAQQSLIRGSGHSSHCYLHTWNRCAPAFPSRDAPTLHPRAVKSTRRGTDGAENKPAKRSILAQTSSLSGLPSGHSNSQDEQDGGPGVWVSYAALLVCAKLKCMWNCSCRPLFYRWNQERLSVPHASCGLVHVETRSHWVDTPWKRTWTPPYCPSTHLWRLRCDCTHQLKRAKEYSRALELCGAAWAATAPGKTSFKH